MIKTGYQLALLELLHQSELFSQISDESLQPIIHNSHRISCEKNKYINFDTSRSKYCHIIEQGEVMLSRVTNDGDTYVIDVVDRGCIFGITTILADGPDSQMLVETIRPTVLWRIPLGVLREIMENNNNFTENLLQMELHTRHLQDVEIEHRTVQNAPQRIACFLLIQCALIDRSPATINLPYNKKLIAAKLGIRQETFSRALKTIKKETGTKVTGSKLIIQDIDALKLFVCNNCSLTYPCQHSLSGGRIY